MFLLKKNTTIFLLDDTCPWETENKKNSKSFFKIWEKEDPKKLSKLETLTWEKIFFKIKFDFSFDLLVYWNLQNS